MRISGVLARFFVIYISLLIITVTIFTYFELPNVSGMNIGIIAAATLFSCTLFAKKNERYFNKNEKTKVVLGFIFINMLIQAVFGFSASAGEISDGKFGVFLFSLGIVSTIHSLLIYFIVSFQKKSLIKQGVISS